VSVSDIILPSAVSFNSKIKSREALLKKFVSCAVPVTKPKMRTLLYNELMKREQIGSTYLGHDCALPHARVRGLKKYYLGFYFSKKGVAFGEQSSVQYIFVLVGPRDDPAGYIKYITQIARVLKDAAARERLQNAATINELKKIISKYEIS